MTFRRPVDENLRETLQQAFRAPSAFVAAIGFVVVEPHYVDADYRDLFYHHYAGKHRSWPRFCERIHCWDHNEEYMGAVIRVQDPYTDSLIPLKYDLTPRWLANNASWHLLTSSKRLHVLNEIYDIPRFPSITQDGEFTRCAHAALWNVLTFLAERFRIYRQHLPTEILSSSAAWQKERSFPSQGLLTEEMSAVLLDAGLYPMIHTASSLDADPKPAYDLLDLLDVYLESGFPLLAGIEHRPGKFFKRNDVKRWHDSKLQAKGEAHAVVIVGHNSNPSGRQPKKRPGLTSRNRNAYLVIDDNNFPYTCMGIDEAPGQRVRIAYGERASDGLPAFNCLSDFIVPLPRRISIFAHEVLHLLTFLSSPDEDNLRLQGRVPLSDLLFRPFLMSAGGWRQSVLNNYTAIGADYLANVALVPLPHFVWVVEVVSRQQPHRAYGHLLLDASAPGVDSNTFDRCLLANHIGWQWFAFNHAGEIASHCFPDEKIWTNPSFPLLRHNLCAANDSRLVPKPR